MTPIAKARASLADQLAAVIPRELGYAAEPGMVVAVGLRPTGRCLWFGAADLVNDPPGDIAADLADLARRSGASDVVLLGYGAPAEAGFADALRLASELATLLPDVQVTEAGVADDVVYARDHTGAGAHRAFTLAEAPPGTRSQTRTAQEPTTPADPPAAPVEGEGPQIAAALDRLEALTGEDGTGHRGSVRATLAGLAGLADFAPVPYTLVDPGAGRADLGAGL